MTTEIELKFIVTQNVVEKLTTRFAATAHQHTSPAVLTNLYFDTSDNQLRRWDMGLRIRGDHSRYEMTLKTAGSTVGGLHQRPEYNVALASPELDIAQLPPEVWPEGTDIAQLQHSLQPQFTTHFTREKWRVTHGESEIEVALDSGDISAGEAKEALNELEMELCHGKPEDLLAFASELKGIDGLRPGYFTKAARGDYLFRGCPERQVRPLPEIKFPAKATVEEGFQLLLSTAFEEWKYHEELWLSGNQQALTAIMQAIDVIRQILAVFGSIVPRKASSDLRQKLTLVSETLNHSPCASSVCYSAVWFDVQLALTGFIALKQWQRVMDVKASHQLQSSFKRFSDIMLGRLVAELKRSFDRQYDLNQYRDKQYRIHHSLPVIQLLAGYYDLSHIVPWLEKWQQFSQAITRQQQSTIESVRLAAIKQPGFWLNS